MGSEGAKRDVVIKCPLGSPKRVSGGTGAAVEGSGKKSLLFFFFIKSRDLVEEQIRSLSRAGDVGELVR